MALRQPGRCAPLSAALSLAVLLAASCRGAMAEPTDGTTPPVVPESAAELPAAALRDGWLFVLPVVTHEPETGTAFGASAAYARRFGGDPLVRPSTFMPVALFTTRSQVLLGLYADAWSEGDRWHLTANLGYRKYPTLFYGIGDRTPAAAEETYTDYSAAAMLELARRVSGPLYLGALLDASHTRLRGFDADGALVRGDVPGAAGGMLWGAGLSVAWDTRDAVLYPTRGWFQRIAVGRYLDVLGGDYRYTWTEAALTRYWSLGGSGVLAANLHGSFLSGGEVPFYRLSRVGLRGYHDERYRERHAVRGQVEVRGGLWRRLGAVAFAGLGEMAASLDRLRLDEVRPMVGGGLRLNVGGEQRANLAVDAGFGDGDSGFYVRFAEAF